MKTKAKAMKTKAGAMNTKAKAVAQEEVARRVAAKKIRESATILEGAVAANNIEDSIVSCVEEAGADTVASARRVGEEGSPNPNKAKTVETNTTAKTIGENETDTEWECIPVGFYWSVHGRPKWKYIVVEKSV